MKLSITIITVLTAAALWVVISETKCSDGPPVYVGGILVGGCR